MEKTRIGVVGIGHLGNYHLQKYQQIEECTIVGVADINEECTQGAADKESKTIKINHPPTRG